MNKLVTTLLFLGLAYTGPALALVPGVDTKGVPAITTCPTSVTGAIIPATAYHSDKIVFTIADILLAANTADQNRLSTLPLNTELDIKVRDNPALVANIKSKVLTFLGAALTATNEQLIKIISVEYAAIVCPKSP
jgi:hypothetical protein